MANPTNIRKGKVIVYQGNPHTVVEMMHRTQGRQAGFVQTTLRNLETGSSTNVKFRSTDSVEFLHTENRKLEYSYKDRDGYHFMDPETYEDILIGTEMAKEAKDFLIENEKYDLLYVDDRPLSIQLPPSVSMKVIEAPEAIKGDTVSNVQKPVTLETGLVVSVPLFIKTGETIRINTDDVSYAGRA